MRRVTVTFTNLRLVRAELGIPLGIFKSSPGATVVLNNCEDRLQVRARVLACGPIASTASVRAEQTTKRAAAPLWARVCVRAQVCPTVEFQQGFLLNVARAGSGTQQGSVDGSGNFLAQDVALVIPTTVAGFGGGCAWLRAACEVHRRSSSRGLARSGLCRLPLVPATLCRLHAEVPGHDADLRPARAAALWRRVRRPARHGPQLLLRLVGPGQHPRGAVQRQLAVRQRV